MTKIINHLRQEISFSIAKDCRSGLRKARSHQAAHTHLTPISSSCR